MSLHKIWLIARREYLINFLRKSFLFTVFGLPALTIGVTLIIILVIARQMSNTSDFERVGIVDHAGIFAGSTVLEEPFEVVESEQVAEAEVKAENMDGYFVLPENYLSAGRIDSYSRPQLGLSEAIQDKLEELIKTTLSKQIDDPELATRLQEPLDEVEIYRIGTNERLQDIVLFASFMIPFIVGFLIFIASSTTSQFLMSGLVEEKETRMLELFVTSVRTSEILWGKLLGLGALGLTQLVVWVIMGGAFALTRNEIDVGNILRSLQITPAYLLLLLSFFVLGYLVNGALMFSIGALVNAEQESRQIGGFVSFISLLPFVLLAFIIADPDNTLSKVMSLFPLTAPVGMVLRMSWVNVPPLEIALSLFLLALTVVGLIWAAAKIFRLGMLNYGKRLGFKDIVRVLRGSSV